METKILNYRIIIEPDKRTGSNTSCYSALCPILGIADSGDTIEEAIENIKKRIEVEPIYQISTSSETSASQAAEPTPVASAEGDLLQ